MAEKALKAIKERERAADKADTKIQETAELLAQQNKAKDEARAIPTASTEAVFSTAAGGRCSSAGG